jgi:hypothetical protein
VLLAFPYACSFDEATPAMVLCLVVVEKSCEIVAGTHSDSDLCMSDPDPVPVLFLRGISDPVPVPAPAVAALALLLRGINRPTNFG